MATLFPSVLPTPIVSAALRSGAELDYNAAQQTFSVTIPPYTFIENIVIDVTTTFSPAAPTMTVGDSGSATQYFAAAGITWSVTGLTQSGLIATGKLYTSADTLYFTWTPAASPTQGVAYISIQHHYLPASAASGAMMAGYQ